MNLNQVTLPALDMEKSTGFFRRMGFLQIVDTPHYARFECPEGDSTFSLSLQENLPASFTTVYFEHEHLDDLVQQLISKEFEFDESPTNHRYLWREAVLHDPAGNRIILYWAGTARKNPPWRVELST